MRTDIAMSIYFFNLKFLNMLTKLNLYQRCIVWTLAIVFCFSIQILTAQTQQKKWYLDGKEIDFSNSVPIVTDIPNVDNSSTTLVPPNNGFYNQEGARLFNLSNDQVINKFGDIIGSLPSSGPEHLGFERGVVPLIDQCGKLFVVKILLVLLTHQVLSYLVV
jgi:hypothetical protein